MAKLYPPNINGTIPAFYYTGGAVQITVPFTMNRAVAPSEVAGFALKIKTITGDLKGVSIVNSDNVIATSKASVTFSIDNISFLVGQYYKIQLAYKDHAGVIGYYSTVGIIKCTTKPEVTIDGLQAGQTNVHTYSYTGVYSQEGKDVTEKMYSSRFLLYDVNQNIIKDSGEILHNTSKDTLPYESYEEFILNQDLSETEVYYLQFIVTTVNQLQVSSLKYKIIQRQLISSDITANLIATMNFNSGYIVLSMVDEVDPAITGTFLLTRASSKNNYAWEEIKRFSLESMPPSTWQYKDYTVEQGIIYKYALQQYNEKGIYSQRIISNTIMADFEDMFLYDGKKQLRIRFNPQVSTYKNTILESKTETIGSKYPFFSRNGNVNYKEFSLSGLISYLMDEAEQFIDMKDIGLDGFFSEKDVYGRYKTTNLVDYNMAAERRFKNLVLDWLNDSNVKLLKTPAEGNYLVRLMNVSLSPENGLSRMLHSFSCSAYEVGEFNLESLNYYGLVDITEKPTLLPRWATVDIKEAVNAYLQESGKTLSQAIGDKIDLNTRNASSLDFRDFIPGAQVMINSQNIVIGSTGTYIVNTTDMNAYSAGSIKYIIDNEPIGQLTYEYYAQVASVFGTVDNMLFYDVPLQQIIGNHYDAKVWDTNITPHNFSATNNLLDSINDARTSIGNIIFIRAQKRPVETLYVKRNTPISNNTSALGNYYTDMYCTERFDLNTVNPLYLYELYYESSISLDNVDTNDQYYIDANIEEFVQSTGYYIDGFDKTIYRFTNDLFSFTLNNSAVIDLTDTQDYYLRDTTYNFTSIIVNNGVIFEMCYTKQVKEYAIESNTVEYRDLYNAKNQYNNEVEIMNNDRINPDVSKAYTQMRIQGLKNKYNTYLYELNKGIDKYKEDNGLD